MSAGPYSMTAPCPKCPFRTDVAPYLRKTRVTEIERGLQTGEFSCHETTTPARDGSGEMRSTADSVHCAGALILMEKLGRSSQMMRIAERLGMYDARKLKMDAPVFPTFAAMRKAQKS